MANSKSTQGPGQSVFGIGQRIVTLLVEMVETRIVRKDGAEVPVIASARTVCNADGAALAALLPAISTSDMARIALERISGAEADAALIDALGKADDKSKIGIVNSLGARKTAAAVPAIAPLLKSKDPLLAEAAAAALGHIGGADATKALKGRMNKAARATAESILREHKA